MALENPDALPESAEAFARGEPLKRILAWVIYALVDPRDETIRYIGRTMEGSTRPFQHWEQRGAGYESGKAKSAWLRELAMSGAGRYEVKILERLADFEETCEAETKWIQHGLAHGWPLTNRRRNGGGRSGIPKALRDERHAAWKRQWEKDREDEAKLAHILRLDAVMTDEGVALIDALRASIGKSAFKDLLLRLLANGVEAYEKAAASKKR